MFESRNSDTKRRRRLTLRAIFHTLEIRPLRSVVAVPIAEVSRQQFVGPIQPPAPDNSTQYDENFASHSALATDSMSHGTSTDTTSDEEPDPDYCAGAVADGDAYAKALADYKLSAAAYSSKVAAYYGLVGVRNAAKRTLDDDIASMKTQFGVTPKITAAASIDPITGKPSSELKVEIDLTGLVSSLGGAKKLKGQIAGDQTTYNDLKTQVANEKASVLQAYGALQTELQNLINLRNQVLDDDANCNCNVQPDGLPDLPDPLNDPDNDGADDPGYDIEYDLPPGFDDGGGG